MNEPRRVPDVPQFPFPDDLRMTPHRSGDWFGPVMIGLAVLVVLAVGFGMVLAVFPGILESEDGGAGEASAVEAELQSALEEGFATESWYEMVVGLTVEDDVIVVQTDAQDEEAEGLDALCAAALDVGAESVDEPAVSIESQAGKAIYACP